MAVNCKWYPLPEVSPAEEQWWEKDRSKTLSNVSKVSLNLSSLTRSSGYTSPAPIESDGPHLSISSLHTSTPLTVDDSSFNTTRQTPSEVTSETSQRRHARKRVNYHDKVKFVPELEAVTELDELWKRFQCSSMVGKENVGVVKCTCSITKRTTEKKVKKTKDFTSEASPTRTHRPLVRRSVLVERAVQTSPAPIVTQPPRPPSHPVVHSPSVMFTVAHQPTTPKINELTLSEAFALSHPEFIEASLRRQREIKWKLEIKNQQNYLPTRPMREPRRPHPHCTSHRLTRHHPTNSPPYTLNCQSHRTKMSKRDMYDASKRVWSQLPEVKAKVLAEKRKSQSLTNRLRMKHYQEEVLSRLRLRRLNKKKH